MSSRALVLGFGGTGSYILTAIKRISVIKYGEKPDRLQFLEFDTLESDDVFYPGKYLEGNKKNNGDCLLKKQEEYYHLGDKKPGLDDHIERYVQPPVDEGYEHFKNWLHASWMKQNLLYSRLGFINGSGQNRQIVRYAMFRNADDILDLIKRRLGKAGGEGAPVPVWLVGSAAGGTGAGTMIDAAFITRKAAKEANVSIEVGGVVVLPSVYKGVPGIDEARVHSFFRELERFQTATNDKFKHDGKKIASFVEYPNFRSNVSNQLFDNLIYVGERCPNESERRGFFTSVGNAIEPYLDGQSGADLLVATANPDRAFSSFGAARLYVPTETYAGLFAQEQMRDYLDAVVPRAEGKKKGVEAGSAGDRENEAKEKVKALLGLDELLKREEWEDNKYKRLLNNLSSREIFTEWWQFNNIASQEDQQVATRAYANPLYSLTEPDPDRVDEAEIRLKTYNELSNSGGGETQEASRDRFYKKLKKIKDGYTNPDGGPNSFEKGRKRIHEVVTEHLIDQIDDDISGDLTGPVTGDDDSGTSLTHVYEELKHILAYHGPLAAVEGVLEKLIAVAEGKKNGAEDSYNAERELLNKAGPSGLLGSWSTWVEAPQQNARDEATEYFNWYQKRELLQELSDIVQKVRERYEKWYAQVKAVVDALAFGEDPLRDDVDGKITRLHGRLQNMTEQGAAMISLDGDTSMHGYCEELRDEAVIGKDGNTLASQMLTASEWEASVDDGQPVLTLAVDGKKARSTESPQSFTEGLRDTLRDEFRSSIGNRLEKRDVFDYLKHIDDNTDFEPADVAAKLEGKSEPLFAGGGEIDIWFVRDSDPLGDPEKSELAKKIRGKVAKKGAAPFDHGDEDALTLVQAKRPQEGDVIPELDDYKKSYTDLIDTGRPADKFKRAPVNHPFRPELEAWFIERYFQKQNPIGAANYYLPPRIVRLLEYPRMMTLFVYCLASEAIEKTKDNLGKDFWVWHNTGEEMKCKLTDPGVGDHDLIQAATTFVLRQEPLNYTVDIDAETASRSARKKAKEHGCSLREMVKGFAQADTIREFIAEHIDDEKTSVEERKGLARVFQFYSQQWGAPHGLQNRTL